MVTINGALQFCFLEARAPPPVMSAKRETPPGPGLPGLPVTFKLAEASQNFNWCRLQIPPTNSAWYEWDTCFRPRLKKWFVVSDDFPCRKYTRGI